MKEPQASRPYWPDALQMASDPSKGLKPWAWALERLEKSHNYWVATTRPEGRPHLMIVWGIWLEAVFWFSAGSRTRKTKNLAAHPHCAIGTEDADEAVIVEGVATPIFEAGAKKRFAATYDCKYGGNIELLLSSGSVVFRVEPQVVFGFDEHAENFSEAATRWKFTNP